jgi:hypothetical protein
VVTITVPKIKTVLKTRAKREKPEVNRMVDTIQVRV